MNAAEEQALHALCHDVIESAASIKLLAHAASSQPAPESSVQDRLRMIATEAGRISEICGQVLNLPRRIELARLDVLAAEAVNSARLRYAGTIDAVLDAVTLCVRPAIIIRILDNLLSNACRAAGPDGRVRLTVAQVADRVRLAVADSGEGLGRGTSGRASLGLEIVGSLVLSCAGTVEMCVSDLGGLCVTVTLPCPPADQADDQQGHVPAAGRSRPSEPGHSRMMSGGTAE